MMTTRLRATLLRLALTGMLAVSSLAQSGQPDTAVNLAGTWTLVAADVKHPDGSRAHDYGEHPEGSLMIDGGGRYSLQIFKSERTTFPAEDKGNGASSDYRTAVMGSSTHYGTVIVDPNDMTLTFRIQDSSFPNWKGESQKRKFTLIDSTLSYFGLPRANGDVPISVWKRIQ
jgi:Lipocalin-like domain